MSSSPWIFVVALASAGLFFASPAIAAPTKRPAAAKSATKTERVKDTVGFIQKNLIFTELGTWGSSLVKDGKRLSIGITTFGRMADLFFEDRIATRHFKSYRGLYTAGFVLTILGLATLLADLVVLTVQPQMLQTTGGLILVTGLLVAGTAMGLAGPLMISASIRRLMKAVKVYNQGVFSRAKQGRWRISMRVFPGGAVGAGVVGVF